MGAVLAMACARRIGMPVCLFVYVCVCAWARVPRELTVSLRRVLQTADCSVYYNGTARARCDDSLSRRRHCSLIGSAAAYGGDERGGGDAVDAKTRCTRHPRMCKGVLFVLVGAYECARVYRELENDYTSARKHHQEKQKLTGV